MSDTYLDDVVIRRLVREAFDLPSASSHLDDDTLTPVEPNAGVDPSAALTDPGNPNYRPQDARELSIALNDILKSVPDERIADVYRIVKQTVGDLLLADTGTVNSERPEHSADVQNPGRAKEMSKKNSTVTEATLRKVIRNMIIETLDLEEGEDEDDAVAAVASVDPAAGAAPADPTAPGAKARKGWGDKSSSSYEKQDLKPYGQIAKELTGADGQPVYKSVSGAKQAVDKAYRRGRFINWSYPDEVVRQDWLNGLVSDYVDTLDNGELTGEDISLMLDHPDIVLELPGFQKFMDAELEDMGYFPDMEFDPKSGAPIFRDR